LTPGRNRLRRTATGAAGDCGVDAGWTELQQVGGGYDQASAGCLTPGQGTERLGRVVAYGAAVEDYSETIQ